jgi:hypothetical protein
MLKSCRANRDKVDFPRESVDLTRNSRVQIVTKGLLKSCQACSDRDKPVQIVTSLFRS